jgi:DNA replicative helicase MCM subunit Mcm2 (Cdc46/Mcm family)
VLNEEYARVVEAELLQEARTARQHRVSARARVLVAGGMPEAAAGAEAWRVVEEEEEGMAAQRERDPVLDDGRRIQVGVGFLGVVGGWGGWGGLWSVLRALAWCELHMMNGGVQTSSFIANPLSTNPPVHHPYRPTNRQVRLFNLRRVAKMRELNPEDVDHLVALRGMVRGYMYIYIYVCVCVVLGGLEGLV